MLQIFYKILLISFILLLIVSGVFLSTKNNQTNENVKGTEVSIFLEKNGTQLKLLGQPYTFTGINIYSAATLWGSNAGCGGQLSDQELDGLFSSLRPNSIVRIWGWQGSMATNPTTRLLDWKGLDRVIYYASLHGQRLIISLGDQAGTCDDKLWKDPSWYNGGFTQVHNSTGMTPLSYWDFVQQIVQRYKDSATIAMWELINEPEASTCSAGYNSTECYAHLSCPNEQTATGSLRYFFDTVGGKIKSIDPNHLIESGVIGNGQCGAVYYDYQYIHESPSIDVASYHDYNDPDRPMPGDEWNGLQMRLTQMKNIQKPLIIGEAGMLALDNSPDCINLATRRDKIKAKMDAQFPAGISGYIPWAWSSVTGTICNYDIPPTDPIMTLLHSYPILEITPIPTPTGLITPTSFYVPTPTLEASPTALLSNSPTTIRYIDTIAPTVSITSPVAGTNIHRGTYITIKASASDNIAVSKVNFYINDALQCSVSSSPYICNWKVPAKNKATYTIRATAIDLNGNFTSVSSKVKAI